MTDVEAVAALIIGVSLLTIAVSLPGDQLIMASIGGGLIGVSTGALVGGAS